MNEITVRVTIESLVKDYEIMKSKVLSAYAELETADKISKQYNEYFKFFPDSAGYFRDADTDKIVADMRRKLWQFILKQTQTDKILTQKRKDEFEKMLNNDKTVPDITIETVTDFVSTIRSATTGIAEEFILEAFHFMKPGVFSSQTYKTNKKSKYEIKPKVIFAGVLDNRFSRTYLPTFWSERFNVINNAFYLLDGKQTPEYPNDITSKINNIEYLPGTTGNEYFDLKVFKNGNIHMNIKRTDILDKINRIAGKHLLKRTVSS